MFKKPVRQMPQRAAKMQVAPAQEKQPAPEKPAASERPRRKTKQKVSLKRRVFQVSSESENDDEQVPPPVQPGKDELGSKTGFIPSIEGRDGFFCYVCKGYYNDPDDVDPDEKWAFCPVCFLANHVCCIKAKGCFCGFKPRRRQF